MEKVNMYHIRKLAEFYQVSKEAMLNAVLLGHFRQELMELVLNDAKSN